ncbi:hypothetical protein M422DRAFT_25500 [Sphaerobolus stellatus SS14]|nr:hypothetical protein M422DRAFT_25500 [Sphaerobolus stellatus SS14]
MFSFAKFSTAALALATLARAELFITSYSVQINGSTTVSWQATDLDTDPSLITVQLGNPQFRSQFALANNIPVTQGTLTIPTPGLTPEDGYTVQLVKIDNVNVIFAETPTFALLNANAVAATSISAGAPSSSTSSTSSTASTSSGSNSTSASASASASTTGTNSVTSPASSAQTAPLTSSASTSSTANIPGTSSGATTTTTNSAASGLVPAGSAALLLAGFVALLL